ncbi:hypothetical protein M758_1G206700 [Ceratodon purpureus]|uniref:CP12 domain-containing protein n=1 Tax=Ceratodon purpureus TaxID=3225 RepID=A0A8T0J7R9_CERPU|nr:hypothetical protein KC19_1G213700 [Ceratodon purpureus]KAG0630839.1 hypothetical protein M758_1G206700 [Ceratodon purpureus]
MAAVTMAASSLVAFVAAPGVASTTSFSKFSSVRMAPIRLNRRLSVVAMAQPNDTKKDLQQQVADAIIEAQKTCEEDPASQPCAVAWDDVEEIAAEAAHQRDRKKTNADPLETYCADNPETDECRVYED